MIRDEVHKTADLRNSTNEEMYSKTMTLLQEVRALRFESTDEGRVR